MRSLLYSTLATGAMAVTLSDNVGRLPSLGSNSWSAFACNINEQIFLDATNVLVQEGLKNAGYNYINIDDCWSIKSGRDSTTGRIMPDLSEFPDGTNGTAQKVHAMGVEIGIYSSAGEITCAGYPASLGHKTTDAQTFADDNDTCHACVPDRANENNWATTTPGSNSTCTDSDICATSYDYSQSNTYSRYNVMSQALSSIDRTILLNLCVWGRADPSQGSGAKLGSSWRVTGDINPQWSRVVEIVNEASFELDAVDFSSHIGMDLLEISNAQSTDEETRPHFALRAGFKSPLLIGANLSNLATSELNVLKDSYLLAFNQDTSVSAPVKPYKWGINADWTFNETSPAELYSGASGNGTLVLMFNPSSATQNKKALFSEMPELKPGSKFRAVDV